MAPPHVPLRFLAVALAALAGPGAGAAMATAAPVAYFTVGPDVYVAPLDGSSTAIRVTGTTGSLAIRGLVLDPARNHLYTTRVLNPAIEVSSLTPGSVLSNVPVVPAGLQNPSGLTIDTGTGTLFWGTEGTGSGNGDLLRAPTSGGGVPITTPGISGKRPWGMALDAASRTIYWTEYASTPLGAIRWTQTDGSAAGSLTTTGATVNAPAAIAVSHIRRSVIWSNAYGISSAAIDGSGGTNLATAFLPRGIAVDDVGRAIYWTQYSGPGMSIQRSDLDGGGVVNVTPPGVPADIPWGLALLFPPTASDAPAVAGAASIGQPLTCPANHWAADAPESFVFKAPFQTGTRWLRDGVTISDATGTNYTPTQAGTIACDTTATNAAGNVFARSDAITVPAAAVPDPTEPVAATPSATPRLLTIAAAWRLRGPGATAAFAPPPTANRFTIVARSRGRATRVGRCRTTGVATRRRTACTITLRKGTWTITAAAARGSTILATSTRTVHIRV